MIDNCLGEKAIENLVEVVSLAQTKASSPYHHIWTTAHAGSGKTRVLVHRVLRLLLAGEQVHKILCITYTRVGAVEMIERLRDMLGNWSVMSDEVLKGELREMGVENVDEATLHRAKDLFLEVLNAPNGLQIYTFHGFCQSVLARFPLEADISPEFQLLSDKAGGSLQRDLSDSIARSHDKRLQSSIVHLSTRLDEASFFGLVQKIYEKCEVFEQIWNYQSVASEPLLVKYIKDMWKELDVAQDKEGLLQQKTSFLEASNVGIILQKITMLEGTGKKIATLKEGVKNWLELDQQSRYENLHSLQEILFTKKNEWRKDAENNLMPDELEELQKNLEWVIIGIDARHGIGRDTEAALVLARSVIADYQHYKYTKGLLDYDDLISKVRLLLGDGRGSQASWVHFKLDGGIRHILVDEAQDTNRLQWSIFEGLAHEFYAGKGVDDAEDLLERTLFVVGDPKQAIFGFQGNDPDAMMASRKRLGENSRAVGKEIEDVALETSFRSSPAILSFVDAVYASKVVQMGINTGEELQHKAFRQTANGFVTLLPLATSQTDEDGEIIKSGVEVLVDRVVDRIESLLGKWLVPSTGEPLQADDILILFRKRKDLFHVMVRTLQRRGFRVSTSLNIKLSESLPVIDVVNLLEVLLDPEDDYRLACLLKSPFVGWGEDAIFQTLYGRKNHSIWSVLKQDSAKKQPALKEWIENLRKYVDIEPPYELVQRILYTMCPCFVEVGSVSRQLSGYQALEGRLGVEASDAIEMLLSKLLDYDKDGVVSLRYFLDDLALSQEEMIKHSDASGGSIRLMTIHGAKGLEAPFVILPETTVFREDQDNSGYSVLDGGASIWYGHSHDVKQSQLAGLRSLSQKRKDKVTEEDMRLLYVGLTRARDGLLLGGAYNKREPLQQSWYYALVEGMKRLGVEGDAGNNNEPRQFGNIEIVSSETIEKSCTGVTSSTAGSENTKNWWYQPFVEEKTTVLETRSASRLTEDIATGKIKSLLKKDNRSIRRGILIHKLLEYLPRVEKSKWHTVGHKILRREGTIFAETKNVEQEKAWKEKILQEVEAVMVDKRFEQLFKEGYAEVPIGGVVELNKRQVTVQGRIDRLLVTPEEIVLVDYKSGRCPEGGKIPSRYIEQMAVYGELARKLWQGRSVRGLLLWTEDISVSELLDNEMRLS